MSTYRLNLLWLATAISTLTAAGTSAITFIVTNSNDAATGGTLREAIGFANTAPGKDTIIFQIQPTGVLATISPSITLPFITESVIINGTSQWGGVRSTPGIELDGSLSTAIDGLRISTTNCEIYGLIINNFPRNGIYISGGGFHQIHNNYIGTDSNGQIAAPNSLHGIHIYQSGRNMIGSAPNNDPKRRNIISGNMGDGIFINGPSSISNIIVNNHIGTDTGGYVRIANEWHGIEISTSRLVIVGNTDPIKPANLISGNKLNGVYIDSGLGMHYLEGNFIGTTRSGNAALGNGLDGVRIYECGPNYVGYNGSEGANTISGNDDDGIEIYGSSSQGNQITANYIGTDDQGLQPVPNNDDGVVLDDQAQQNYVGGSGGIYDRNIISGNKGCGVVLTGDARGNYIEGNYIGLDVNGISPITNEEYGVMATLFAHGNFIGNVLPNTGNIISGNGLTEPFHAIMLEGNSYENTVAGNIIGLNAADQPVPNAGDGIHVENSYSNTIGGIMPLRGNVISANGTLSGGGEGDGIQLGPTSAYNLVYLNMIGVSTNGNDSRGNQQNGIYILQSAHNQIGGIMYGNLISGNKANGIKIEHLASANNSVIKNVIGLNKLGNAAISNNQCGIEIFGAPSSVIGGTNNEGNIICANLSHGISISQSSATNTVIQGNRIGLNQGGNPFPNKRSGITILNAALRNMIGGTNFGSGNIIAYNGEYGLLLNDPGTTNNSILGNSIYANTNRGIKLTLAPLTNDVGDVDSGPNELQNWPVLNSAMTGSVIVSGRLFSRPSTTYRIEYFLNSGPDPSGYGEGQTFMLSTNIATSASGTNVFFDVVFTNAVNTSQYLTATATDPMGNTSEFGNWVRIVTADEYDPDGDGIPSSWETDHGMDDHDATGDDGAEGDPDGDTVDNYDEYVADTDPTNDTSYLCITNIARSNLTALVYTSTNTRYYLVMGATNLAEADCWTNLYSPATQGSNGYTVAIDGDTFSSRYYQVKAQLAP